MTPTTRRAITLDEIAADAGTQIRAAISEQVVADYAERMGEGVVFPPVMLFHDGTRYHLADGFHRVLAANRTGATAIDAELKPGTKTDALWYALGANKTNGHRLTPADKKHAILIAVTTWPERSARDVAVQIGCAHQYVSRLKSAQVSTSGHLPDRVTGADGKSYPARRPASSERPTPDDDRARSTTTVRVQQLDPTLIIERTTRCADAEAASFQSDTFLINFGSVDREQLITCIGALRNQRRALSAVIRRLESFVG